MFNPKKGPDSAKAYGYMQPKQSILTPSKDVYHIFDTLDHTYLFMGYHSVVLEEKALDGINKVCLSISQVCLSK